MNTVASSAEDSNFLDILTSIDGHTENAAFPERKYRLVGFGYRAIRAEGCRVGQQLLGVAETLHATRQFDELNRTSRLVLSLPAPKSILAAALYYQALCAIQRGTGNYDKAQTMLNLAIQHAPMLYRARAIFCSGSIVRWTAPDPQASLPLYLESLRRASYHESRDIYTILGANRMIAVLRSLEGDSKSAVAHLEHLLPIAETARRIRPELYYDTLNSLAVEKGEIGRIKEGLAISQAVIGSPFIGRYPEWMETYNELKARLPVRSRLLNADSRPSNIIPLPPSSSFTKSDQSLASIVMFCPTRPNDRGPREVDEAALKALAHSERVTLIIRLRYLERWFEVCNDELQGNISKTIDRLRELLRKIQLSQSASAARVHIRASHLAVDVFEGGIRSSAVIRLLRFIQQIRRCPIV